MIPSNILIIGGNGFLGYHIVDQFLKYKWQGKLNLTVLDIRPPSDDTRRQGVKYITGDMLSKTDMKTALEGIDLIIHTASPIHGLGHEVYIKVNVDGTRNVIEVAKEMGVAGMVYTSSAGVVFNGGDLVNVDETAPIPENAMDAYNDSKAVAETLVLEASSEFFKTCAIRPAGLFGEGDRQLIPGMLNVLKNKQDKYQIGNNDNLFDFTYIGNAAYAHILAAEKLLENDRVAGEAFFITNGSPIYFWDFPRALYALDGHPGRKRYFWIPAAAAHYVAILAETFSFITRREPTFTRFRVQFTCANRYYDISKARSVLGYTPLIGLEEGMKRSLAWVHKNNP